MKFFQTMLECFPFYLKIVTFGCNFMSQQYIYVCIVVQTYFFFYHMLVLQLVWLVHPLGEGLVFFKFGFVCPAFRPGFVYFG